MLFDRVFWQAKVQIHAFPIYIYWLDKMNYNIETYLVVLIVN